MKKILSTVAALGVVAGLAGTASALEFKATGLYKVDGFILSDGAEGGMALTEMSGAEGGTIDNPSDAYYMHSFYVNPTLKVNDSVSVMGQVRLLDNDVWGAQDYGREQQLNNNIPGNNSFDGTDFNLFHLYMDYMSDIGKLRIGRAPKGPYGPTFMDLDQHADRILLWPSFMPKPWSMLLIVEKTVEDDYDLWNGSPHDDSDSDLYEFRVSHKTDTGDAAIRYVHQIDKAASESFDNLTQHLQAYGIYKLGTINLQAELLYKFGEKDYEAATSTDVDVDAWAGYINVGTTMDAITVSGLYAYASGDDDTGDDDVENYMTSSVGTGTEFEPFYILTGQRTGILNADMGSTYSCVAEAGLHLFGVLADYKVSDKLTLHGGIAYGMAVEEEDADDASTTGRDDEYGIEYNIGAGYKLLDNLAYEAHFGYLDTGEFFESSVDAGDEESVYLMSHHLTMTF